MKLVRVRIRRGDPMMGERQMVYPQRYRPQVVDAHGFILPNGYSGHIGLGNEEEYVIIALEDTVADAYANDPDMDIVTEEEADADLEEWATMRGEPQERVTDPIRLQAIVAKQGAGITLSDEDLAALDPDSPVPGINRRPKASEAMARANAAKANLEARRARR